MRRGDVTVIDIGNEIEVRHAWDFAVGRRHSDPDHHPAVSLPRSLTIGQQGGGSPHGPTRRHLLAFILAGQSWDRQFGTIAASLLAQLIVAARKDALAAGARPVSAGVARQLSGWFPPELMQAVRWSVGGNQLSLPGLALQYGDATAITLIDVVLFRREADAQQDAKLWAHELTHVGQYRRWGVEGFAARYVADSGALEREASDNADRFAAWRTGQTRVSPR